MDQPGDFAKCWELFKDAHDKKMFSAGAISFGIGNTVLFTDVIGNVSYSPGSAPVTEYTLFDMASVTKILSTTMCALKYIDEGKLSLSNKLSDFFDNIPEEKGNIDILKLMTHSSGLPAWLPLYTLCDSPSDVTRTILDCQLSYKPGEGAEYSCMGFILLGKILEIISKTRLDLLAKQLVFDSFGMKNTGYRPVDESQVDELIAYTELVNKNGPTPPGRVHDENARFQNGISGNAGVFSNITDMTKFCSELASEKGGLSPELFETALINYTPGTGENRGLGFQLSSPELTFMGNECKDRAYGHNGFTGTSFLIDKSSGFYMVLLTNRVHPTREDSRFYPVRRQIHDEAFRILNKSIFHIH